MKKTISIFLSLAFTVVLVYFLFGQINPVTIIDALARIPVGLLVSAFLLASLIQLVRGIRAWLFLKYALSIRLLTEITCVHNAWVNILPARTGEFSYVYLLKKHGTSVGTGFGTLALARVFDVVAIAVLFFLSALVVDIPASLDGLRVPVLILLTALFLAIILIVSNHKKLLYLSAKIKQKSTHKFLVWFTTKLEEIMHSLQILRSPIPVLGALSCSFIIWLLQFSVCHLIFLGIGLELSFAQVAFASSVTALLSALPVQGFAGLGTSESFWSIGLLSVGLTSTQAITASFAVHLLTLFFALINGLYGFVMLKLKKF